MHACSDAASIIACPTFPFLFARAVLIAHSLYSNAFSKPRRKYTWSLLGIILPHTCNIELRRRCPQQLSSPSIQHHHDFLSTVLSVFPHTLLDQAIIMPKSHHALQRPRTLGLDIPATISRPAIPCESPNREAVHPRLAVCRSDIETTECKRVSQQYLARRSDVNHQG